MKRKSSCVRIAFLMPALFLTACASNLPQEHHSSYEFPDQSVYVDAPTGKNAKRPYETLGWVRTKSHWPTMEQDTTNSPILCRNYYNKSAASLLKEARKAGGDAVMEVRSVVILMDGKIEEHKTPECSDDGAEGEILLRGIAIKWKPDPKKQ